MKERDGWNYSFPIGDLEIEADGTGITYIGFLKQDTEPNCRRRETPMIVEAKRQLDEYFAGRRKEFDFPLSMQGTPFQKKVWKALRQIPYGETRSYQEIAEAVGNQKACRAVGMANHHNPVLIAVPCHRVIGKNGSLVGYGGGLDVKKQLLELEKQFT
ncbi:MAG: methylated-DNA--[protein]-cysteine S-methyltransferase [Lachnospiraceae bacterium]|jgi:methylated-DNA-[protein]-cysteine S-methyltransferase